MPVAALPPDARPYRRTQIFTETTIPSGLLKAHTTKEGSWAVIHVLEGTLRYTIADPRRSPSEQILTPAVAPGIVEPTIVHRVEPCGAVRFFVEFHRRADPTGPAPI